MHQEGIKSMHIPLRPVLSASTNTPFTFPSSIWRAYLLLRSLPKTAALSNVRSRALLKSPLGSARKRIYLNMLDGIC